MKIKIITYMYNCLAVEKKSLDIEFKIIKKRSVNNYNWNKIMRFYK